eukprot:TRINITY_DN1338_c0_g1_i12.p1 TRINITY_DN1338_c0_g1~~TRINITY_DN1338_c0_g1_i12.p1  ORF type:complete len:576 (-),score=110.26 TRINITY_DN1338_c0_g1_i12:124-1743(-)
MAPVGTTRRPIPGPTLEPTEGTTRWPTLGSTFEPPEGTTRRPTHGSTSEPPEASPTTEREPIPAPCPGTTRRPIRPTLEPTEDKPAPCSTRFPNPLYASVQSTTPCNTGRTSADGIWNAAAIRKVQTFLAGAGEYKGPIDGEWNLESKEAMQSFLKDSGYYDGALDGRTSFARAMQSWLRDSGIPVTIDGEWTVNTTAALKQFMNVGEEHGSAASLASNYASLEHADGHVEDADESIFKLNEGKRQLHDEFLDDKKQVSSGIEMAEVEGDLVLGQPGYFSTRLRQFASIGACEASEIRENTSLPRGCVDVRNLKCAGDSDELCFKRDDACFIGGVKVPAGLKVSLFEGPFNGCKGEPKVTHEAGALYEFWSDSTKPLPKERQVCSMLVELTKGWTCDEEKRNAALHSEKPNPALFDYFQHMETPHEPEFGVSAGQELSQLQTDASASEAQEKVDAPALFDYLQHLETSRGSEFGVNAGQVSQPLETSGLEDMISRKAVEGESQQTQEILDEEARIFVNEMLKKDKARKDGDKWWMQYGV